MGSSPIDVVIVNLYPFAETAKNPATSGSTSSSRRSTSADLSMVRAAAKNFRDVLVVVDPADYPRLLEALDRTPPSRSATS